MIKKMLPKSHFFRGVSTLAGGTVLGYSILAIATPIITRLYTPEALGILALFMSIALILAAVGGLRYEYAIMLPQKDEEAVHILSLSCLITLLITSLLLFGLYFYRYQVADLLGMAELAQWLWLIPIVLLLKGLFQIFNFWFVRKKQFVQIAVAGVGRSIATTGIQIGAALLTNMGTAGLILGVISGEAVATSVLSSNIRRHFRLLKDSCFWSSVLGYIRKYKNFPIYTAPYSFVAVCAKQSLLPLISMYATTCEVGLFALAIRFTRLPAGLISGAIKPVFFQKAATELGSRSLERLVIRILTVEIIVATPMLLLFLYNARWVCRIVFGDAWADVSTYATWLALPAFMLLLVGWLDNIYHVSGSQRLALWLEVVYDFVSIAVFAIALAWLKSVELAVGLFSVITAIYYAFWLIMSFRVANFQMSGLLRLGAIFAGIISTSGIIYGITAMMFSRVEAATICLVLMALYYCFIGGKYRHYWNMRGI